MQWTYLAVRESADERVVKKVIEKLDRWSQIIGQEKNVTSLRNAVSDSSDPEVHRQVMRELFEELGAEEEVA